MTTPLDSRQLRAFVILARTGSFTHAAKQVFLSQSAVSHAMKALEQDVGCRLLDRVGKKVSLTQAGEQLLHHAERILNEMQLARTSLEHLGKWGQSRLRVGASSTACRYILPPVLREFKNDYPQCLISIGSGDAAEALQRLENNHIDLAIVLEPKHHDAFDLHPLFEDELKFIVAPTHPWAVQGSVERLEIPRQNYILYQKNSYTQRLTEEYFRQEKMVLNTVMELGSMEAIKELVSLGLGVSILSPWIAERELKEKSLVALPLGKRKLKRSWVIASRKGRRLSIAEETFVKLCRNYTATLNQVVTS